MRKALGTTLVAGAGLAVAAVVLGRETGPARALRRNVGAVGRRARYELGRVHGLVYSVTGRRPDPMVSDDIMADRIRSGLGPLEQRLDIPRLHVMVENHVALLHGEVPSVADRASIEWAVLDTAGVRGIESYLHVGLLPSDTRPSEGRAEAARSPSEAMHRLLEATVRAGVDPVDGRTAVRAVLATFAERIPEDERAQLLVHLPADVRELAQSPRRSGEPATRAR
ncbi:MAG: BON domain-containing protein, partial [Acidimicrobiia bacterium]